MSSSPPSQIPARPALPPRHHLLPKVKSTAPPRRTVTVWIGDASFQAVVV